MISRYDSKYLLLNTNIFNVNNSYYRKLPYKAFTAIKDNPNLIKHLLLILRSRSSTIKVADKTGIISTMPISYFAEIEGVSDKTIYRYNEELEDKKILYINKRDILESI